ncbi:MAG: hypothetical protein QOF83_1702 [Solirubrobacteraceae bacterium]|nr:hypothetical protein [Solirubrobacteraceae bacterium]
MSVRTSPPEGLSDQMATQAPRCLRLLVVAPFPPRHDNRHGGRVLAQLLEHLVARHEVGVVHLARDDEAAMDSELVARCAFVQTVRLHSRWRLGPRWRSRARVVESLLTGRPTAVVAVHSRSLGRLVRSVADRWQPDVVQLEGDVVADCAFPLDGCRAATMLVIHDPGLPTASEMVAATRGRQRLAHRLDAAAWRRYWGRLLPRFQAVVTLTEDDAQAVVAAVPGVTPVAIPLGIEIPPAPLDPVGSGASSVVFVGGYAHTPNIDAALRLLRSIMPSVRVRVPGVKLMIVGDNPSDEMRAAAGAHDEITGRVPAVAPYLDRAAVVALPIRLGGGMRVKLLEALAAGKAVVASPVAAAGLAAHDGHVLRIADSDEDFTTAITELIADDQARINLGHGARRWAESHLSWSSRRARYEEVYFALLDITRERTESITRR